MTATRFAPTPSGFLHRGNVVNALMVWSHARLRGLPVALRIDDLDADRYRPECVDDIFRVLERLEVEWTAGPRDRHDLESAWSQRHRMPAYREAIVALQDSPDTYACVCSRRDMAEWSGPGCPRGCRSRNVRLAVEESVLRLANEGDDADAVVWRRDGLPAYHLASVVDDRDLGVALIVRGDDLRSAEDIQRRIAAIIGASSVVDAEYVYHPLVHGLDAQKLSKSKAASSVTDAELDSLRGLLEQATSPDALLDLLLH